MCGICGIVHLEGEGMDAEPILRQMTAAQKHRGPDDEGYFCEPGIGLGFCRLAIIDLSPAGHQPMTNEDGTIWLVFNGEIYNFQELVPELERAGHRFRSRCDSEVLIHAYEQWGVDCLQRLNGMFAFAIWDSRKRILFIARDRLGVKPLYYWSDGAHFAFASELKALMASLMVARELNMRALQSYLVYEYIAAPESIFQGVAKLPAGHWLQIPLDGSARGRASVDWEPRQYWDVHFQRSESRPRPLDDYVYELRTLLRAAVKRRLISDVPLGVFLSGGLDLSSVIALMTEVSAERPRTFSIGYGEKSFNELNYAGLLARHFDTDHHVEVLRPDVNNLIATVTAILDEPVADASVLPTYLVSQMARRNVTVALAGDAGDELFAGYDWYRAQKLAAATLDLLPRKVRQLLGVYAQHIPPSSRKKGLRNITRRFLDVANLPVAMQHTRWQTFWGSEDLANLLLLAEPEMYPGYDPRLQALFAASGSNVPLDQQQYVDIKRFLPDDILFKVDRMSMAVSLETRGPFLDYTLVEFAARLPASLRLHGLTSKYLLKRAMQDVLPAEILQRPKLGFNIPYKNWLRCELRDLLQDALAPTRLAQQGIFHPRYVQRLISQHLQGTRDHAHQLWQLLIFQLWLEQYRGDGQGGLVASGSTYAARQVTSSL